MLVSPAKEELQNGFCYDSFCSFMAKELLRRAQVVGGSWLSSWAFPGKRGRSVSGRGKMQIADTREPGKSIQTMECEEQKICILKMTAKWS